MKHRYAVVFDNGNLIFCLGITKSYIKALGMVMQYMIDESRNHHNIETFEFVDQDNMEGNMGEFFKFNDGISDCYIYILFEEVEK